MQTPEKNYELGINPSCYSCSYFYQCNQRPDEKVVFKIGDRRRTIYFKYGATYCEKLHQKIDKRDLSGMGHSRNCPYRINKYTHTCIACGKPMYSPRTICPTCKRTNEDFKGYRDTEFLEYKKRLRDKATILKGRKTMDMNRKTNILESLMDCSIISSTLGYSGSYEFSDLKSLRLYLEYKLVEEKDLFESRQLGELCYIPLDMLLFENLLLVQLNSDKEFPWLLLKSFDYNRSYILIGDFGIWRMLTRKHFSPLIQKARKISLQGVLKGTQKNWKFYSKY